MRAFHLKDFQVLYRLLNIEIILLTREIQPVQEQYVGNCRKTYIEHAGQFSRGSKHTGFKQNCWLNLGEEAGQTAFYVEH